MFKSHIKNQGYLSLLGCLLVLALVTSAYGQESPGPNSPALKHQTFNLSPIPTTTDNANKRVETLTPGQSIKMEGGSDVRIVSEDGRIQITSKQGSVILFEGFVKNAAKPWLEDRPVLATEVSTAPKERLVPQFKIDLGSAEVEVVPGQDLRLASPLIISAVRGTKFAMTVTDDGSSTLDVLEGKVLSMARNGQVELLEKGKGVALTAAKFTQFLKDANVKVPEGGDWRNVDPAVLSEAVQSAFGDALDFLNVPMPKVLEAPKLQMAKVLEANAKGPKFTPPKEEGKYPRKDMAARP